MHNAAQIAEWLQALELGQVAVTATIDSTGRLGAVGGLWSKLLAASKEAAQMGLLRLVVVAADQADIAPELLDPAATPLRVLKAVTLQEVIQQLYEEYGPRHAIRRYEREQSASIDILGKAVSIERYYQTLPLLREVNRELLPKEEENAFLLDAHERSQREDTDPPGAELLRWEEELQQEYVSYERLSLPDIFQRFSSIVGHALPHTPRFVILGPPGSGKTTLIQYLGWLAVTGSLHIDAPPLITARVPLREWETWTLSDKHQGRDFVQYLTERHAHIPQAPKAEHWQRWLSQGEVLLLFDGLDEITNHPVFHNVFKTSLTMFPNCPTVMTCRTVSFARYHSLGPDFPVFMLGGFDDQTRNAYIRAFPVEGRASYDPEALISHLDQTPHLRALATNPLLLSIFCSVVRQRQGGPLPATRASVYQQALTGLLTQRAHRTQVQYPGEEPTQEEKLVLLQCTAFHLFTQEERRLTFTSDELGQALKLALKEEGYGNATAPWANALRTDLTQNSGLLRHSADQTFFFLHVTVQEFLVAANLSRFINTNGWHVQIPVSGSNVSARALLDAKAWDPRWREVLIFLAGQLREVQPLLQLLADQKRDDLFRHRLGLAASCLSERIGTTSGHTALNDRIVTTVLTQWEQHRRGNSDAAIPHITHALLTLGQVNGRIEGLSLFQWVQQRLRVASTEDLRAGVVELLGRLGAPTVQQPEGITALVAALEDTATTIRAEAVMACHRIGAAAFQQPDVRRAVEHLAQSDPDSFVRSRAATVLAEQNARATCTRHAHTLPNQRTTRQPSVLASQPSLQAPTIEELLTALASEDRGQRAQAAHALSEQGIAVIRHAGAMALLLQTALHDTDGGVRAQAAAAFGQLGPEVTQHPHALPALAAILRDRDKGVRAQAAKALGQIGATSITHPYVLPDLLSALHDEDSYVRFRTAEALGRIMAQGVRIFRRWWTRWESKTVEELAVVKR